MVLVFKYMVDLSWLLSDLTLAEHVSRSHGPISSQRTVSYHSLIHCCPACPTQLIVVHGEGAEADSEMRRRGAAAGCAPSSTTTTTTFHRPPLPIQWGTHHTKAFLLTYPTGLRLIVFTANAIYADCNDKTQVGQVQVQVCLSASVH